MPAWSWMGNEAGVMNPFKVLLVFLAAVTLPPGAAMARNNAPAITSTVSSHNQMAKASVLFVGSLQGRSLKGYALGIVSGLEAGGHHTIRFVPQKDGWFNRTGLVSDNSSFYFPRVDGKHSACEIVRTDINLSSEQIIFSGPDDCGLVGSLTHQGIDYLLVTRVHASHFLRGVPIPSDVSLAMLEVQEGARTRIVSDTHGIYENSGGILVDPVLGVIKGANSPGKGVNPVPGAFLAWRRGDLATGKFGVFPDFSSAYAYLAGAATNPISAAFVTENYAPRTSEAEQSRLLTPLPDNAPEVFFQARDGKKFIPDSGLVLWHRTGKVRTDFGAHDFRGSAVVTPARLEQGTLIPYYYYEYQGTLPFTPVQSGMIDAGDVQRFATKRAR